MPSSGGRLDYISGKLEGYELRGLECEDRMGAGGMIIRSVYVLVKAQRRQRR